MKHYNRSQLEAIRHKDGPMLVLAGPGSGKTAVITERTANLIIHEQVDPASILVITFTRQAAAEMKERFMRLMEEKGWGEEKSRGVTFGTLHATFFMILKAAYGYTSANIVTGDQQYQFLREILSYTRLDLQDEGDAVAGLLAEISRVKNSCLEPESFSSAVCSPEIFGRIFREYQNRLNRSHLLDFDDMLGYTLELLKERTDILGLWQKKFTYILIDEFQDINRLQYEIVRLLAAPQNNLFVVGDDDQSIYRFRGSCPDLMLGFPDDYKDTRKVVLDVNYRSGRYINETATNLISHNSRRFAKEIRTANKGEEPVRYLRFASQKEENEWILRNLKERLERGADPAGIVLLFRTNTGAEGLAAKLVEGSLPFSLRDHIPNLYEHWIARDFFTYIRLSRGSRARADFLQILNRPARYLSRDCLREERVHFEEWEKEYADQPWMAERIRKLQTDLNRMAAFSPYAAINYLRKAVGYDAFLEEYAAKRCMDVSELNRIADRLQQAARGFATMEAWQAHIREYSAALKAAAGKRKTEREGLVLSTLHSVKGLEFDTVYLVDANEGNMPYKKALTEEEIEEERRLFYVGMTRARAELVICSTGSAMDRNMKPSRFIEESRQKPRENGGKEVRKGAGISGALSLPAGKLLHK